MPLFDKDDIRLTLEAMKLSQASLQQIMTLSAGGLVLYFSFIAKASFLIGRNLLGILVVLSWILSLVAAIIAHYFHTSLFLALHRLSHTRDRAEQLQGLPDRVKEEVQEAIDPTAVIARARELLDQEHQKIDKAHREFERTFFPTQAATRILTAASLTALVFGFVVLAVGYVTSL